MFKKNMLNNWIILIALVILFCILGRALTNAQNQKIPTAELPALVTAPGLSAEIEVVKILSEQINLNLVFNTFADAKDLKKDDQPQYKTLIVMIGGSMKALYDAFLDVKEEIKRAERLIEEAKNLNMFILGIHIGGEIRRGEISDKLISAVTPKVDFAIVRADGNKDGIFTDITNKYKIPLKIISNSKEIQEELNKLFSLEE